MTSSYIRDFITSTLTESAAGVPSAPTVSAPTPFDEEQRDRSFEKFRITRPDSDSGGVASSGFYSSADSNAPFTGQFQVGSLSGTVENTFVGAPMELRGAMSTVGLGTFMALGSGMSYRMLSHIEKKMLEGDPNYGLAMVNGRIVGVSPSILGDKSYGFTGVLPGNLSHDQRVQLRNMILGAGKPLPYRQTPDYFPGAVDEQVGVAPRLEPTDEERAAAAGSNIVYDDKGQPVKVGDTDDYVTTKSGQYVSQTELQKQNAARQAAEAAKAATARAEAERFAREQQRLANQRESDNDNSSSSRGSGRTESAGADWSAPSGGSNNPADRGYSMGAKGGRVGMADGGSADPVQNNGFVDGSPDNYTKSQTVADDEYRQVRVGSFVLNAPTTEKLQEAGVLPKGVDNSGKNTIIKANKGGMMDVALSKGEYVLEPEEAKQIGYDVLNKINDQGKPEVDRRQAMGRGGMTGTPEELEAALTGVPSDSSEPIELEYIHGKSEFDGTYNRPPLSPEAQALLDAAETVRSERSSMYAPFAAKDRSGMIDVATEMTGIDSMRRFKSLGYDKLFPAADADTITKLTSLPDIIFDDSFDPDPGTYGFYQREDDEVRVFPERIAYTNRNTYGQDPADNYKLRALPIELLYGWSVENTAFHELLHLGYAKQIRRNLPFKNALLAELATNMGDVFAYRNYAPSKLAKKVDAQLDKMSSLTKGSKEYNEARMVFRELSDEASLYEPDQNHSAMMFYEIDRIRAETQDLPVDRRVIARQQIASRAFRYMPEVMKKGNVAFRQEILSRPEFKELRTALLDNPDYVRSEMNEYGLFYVRPKLFADLAIKNPELLEQLDQFTTEYLEAMQEVHGNYSSEFRAALQAQDINDLPEGSDIRKRAERNIRSKDAMKEYPSYFLYKNRYQAYPLDRRQDGFLDIPNSSATR